MAASFTKDGITASYVTPLINTTDTKGKEKF